MIFRESERGIVEKNMNIFIICEEYDLLYIESRFWLSGSRSVMTSALTWKNTKACLIHVGSVKSHA